MIYKIMRSKEIRKIWQDFWENKRRWHIHLSEVSLIAEKDSTAMFNLAWMQQLIPYLSGKKHNSWEKLYNIQKCIRTNDLDEVWDVSHLTLFEMMWNWSLGNYFKKEAVEYSYDFLVNYLKLDNKKLAVSVFKWDKNVWRDLETTKYWKEIWIPEHKIIALWIEENWWSPWPVWPCGPDTEIFYWIWKDDFPSNNSNPKTDEKNWLEIRNNVFMTYYKDENWELMNLVNRNIDTWMGLERLVMISEWKKTIFDTDLFFPIIQNLEKILWLNYSENKRRFRIIVDHVRTVIFLIQAWVLPSNEKRWYVLRRIIRRMYYNIYILNFNINHNILSDFVWDTIDFIVWNYDLDKKCFERWNILSIFFKEINQFQKTINKWIKLLNDLLTTWVKNISWENTFKLYDTFWFPIELTEEICLEKNIKIDKKWFKERLNSAKEKSRKYSKFQQNIDWSNYIKWIPQTEFVWYSELNISNFKILKDFIVNWQRILIFDKTPFYAESGGQKSDNWKLFLREEEINIIDVQNYSWIFLHFVK
jgi:alanyl-tRNA synthetase